MASILCTNIDTLLTCPLTASGLFLRVPATDAYQFDIPPDSYVLLTISHTHGAEDVVFSGGPIVDGLIPVTRPNGGNAFPTGARVSAEISCAFLQEFVCQQVARCATVVGETGTDITQLENTWARVNRFVRGLFIGNVKIDPTDEVANKALLIDSGLWVNYQTAIPNTAYGYLAAITRTSGAATTVGARFEAKVNAAVSSEVVGVSANAWVSANSLAPASATTSTVYQESSNNVAAKAGVRVVFRNRPDGVSTPFSGLGGNKYNANTVGIAIESSGRGSAGEFCGWNRGIVFRPSGLDATSTSKAVGIDFSDIPDSELSRIEAGVRMKHDMALEFNADAVAYTALKLVYKRPSKTLQLTYGADFRFGISSDNGRLAFSDSNAIAPLLANTAGAATGKFLPIEVNGVIYKIALLAV